MATALGYGPETYPWVKVSLAKVHWEMLHGSGFTGEIVLQELLPDDAVSDLCLEDKWFAGLNAAETEFVFLSWVDVCGGVVIPRSVNSSGV